MNPTPAMNSRDTASAMSDGDRTPVTTGGDPTPATNGGDPVPAMNDGDPARAMNGEDPTLAANSEDPTLAPSSEDPTLATSGGDENAPRENNWATRNPTKDVIPSRHRQALTEAQLASRRLATKTKNASRALLMRDVDEYIEELDGKIQEIADKHSIKQEYVRKLINPVSTYRKTRAPTLPNAIAHIKALEINESKSQY